MIRGTTPVVTRSCALWSAAMLTRLTAMIAAVSARIAPKQRPSLTDRRTFPSRGMRRGDGRRIARGSAVGAPSLSSPATMCVNGNRVDPARTGLRDPHRREPELVRRRPDLHRLALDRLRRPVRPDDGLHHGRRLRGPLLPVADAARARARVGRAAQRDRDRGHRPVVLRRHRQAQPRQRVAGRGVPRQRGRARGHAADRGRCPASAGCWPAGAGTSATRSSCATTRGPRWPCSAGWHWSTPGSSSST